MFPFVSEGFQSLIGNVEDQKPVRIQRDTGVSQHYIYSVFLPLNAETSCKTSNTVLGIEMGYVPAPLHLVSIVKIDLIFFITICDSFLKC